MTAVLGEHWATGRVAHVILDVLWEAAAAGQLVTCDVCGATWYGFAADVECGWCAQALERAQDRAKFEVLSPPDIGEDHELREAAFAHWAGELRHAVDAGIVSRAEAETAWRRAQ